MRSRTVGFDLIRITAAFVVFLKHVDENGGQDPFRVTSHGGLAVMAFFVLSGYLIYKPFLSRKIRYSEHLSNRLLRIVPAWALAILIVATLTPAALPALVRVTWSLLVELAFYVILPPLARILAGRELPVLSVMSIVSLAIYWSVVSLKVPIAAMPLMLPMFFWAFAPGMCLAVWERDKRRLPRPRTLVVAGVSLLVGGFIWASAGDSVGQDSAGPGALVALGTVALMGASMTWQSTRATKTITLAADASYPFYLWHASVLASLAPGLQGLPLGLVGLVITVGVSLASVLVVERPLRRAWAWVKRRPENGGAGSAGKADPAGLLHVPAGPAQAVDPALLAGQVLELGGRSNVVHGQLD